MIFHFPNLVCWYDVYKNYKSGEDIIFLDSISCFLLGVFFGVKGTYFSGPEVANLLYRKKSINLFFLLPDDIKVIDDKKKMILPFKDNFEGDKDLLEFIKLIPANSYVVIGVSSPKQNILAQYLCKIRADLKYFCLGAAVKQTWDYKHANTFFRGTGLQWLEFIFFQPKRTLTKIYLTLRQAMYVVISKSKRNSYKEFVELTKKNHKQNVIDII